MNSTNGDCVLPGDARKKPCTRMTDQTQPSGRIGPKDQLQRYFEETIVPGWGEALGQMRAEAREEFTSRIHKLEVELAEMRGELKGLREARQMVTSEPSQ